MYRAVTLAEDLFLKNVLYLFYADSCFLTRLVENLTNKVSGAYGEVEALIDALSPKL